MGVYDQDKVARRCAICLAEIRPGEKMMDFFREASADGSTKVRWCHLRCVERAVETWLKKKEQAAETAGKEHTD